MYVLKIKECRIDAGFTQSDLAEFLNISPSYYSELENGTYPIKIDTLDKIRKFLNVSINDLVAFD